MKKRLVILIIDEDIAEDEQATAVVVAGTVIDIGCDGWGLVGKVSSMRAIADCYSMWYAGLFETCPCSTACVFTG